ncbi:MAG: hypothetical protein ACFFC7_31750 [Candidatus Hermodarchaeota archaeon]
MIEEAYVYSIRETVGSWSRKLVVYSYRWKGSQQSAQGLIDAFRSISTINYTRPENWWWGDGKDPRQDA